MAWTTPGTAVAGEVLTAAYLNTNIRDNLNALDAAGANDVGLVLIETLALSGSATTFEGVFSSAYRNYKIIADGFLVNNTSALIQLLSGPSVISTNYVSSFLRDDGSSSTRGSATNAFFSAAGGQSGFSFDGTIFAPNLAQKTFFTSVFFGAAGASSFVGNAAGQHTLTTAYDGFRIVGGSGDLSSGSCSVYGIK